MHFTMQKLLMALAVLASVSLGAITIGAMSMGAMAFQVQEKSAGSTAPAAAATPPAASEIKPEFKLEMPDTTGGKAGTEIRIPGLGKLGVIPKMDFGLELLYGANQGQKERVEPPVRAGEDGELAIRGSIRHRF